MRYFLFIIPMLFTHAVLSAQSRMNEATPASDRKAAVEAKERKASGEATAKSGSTASETFTYKLITLRLDDYGFVQPESANELRANLKGAIADSPSPEQVEQLQQEMETMAKFRTPVGLLNKLGEEGWELVHVISQPVERSTRVQYYLKKRVKRP
jgi:hypothetical protein